MSDDLSSNTVAELKVMCKEHGLSVSGKKSDLISRLEEHLNEESISMEDSISLEEETVEVETVPLPKIDDDENVPLPKTDQEDEEVLVAEVIEADLVDVEVPSYKEAKVSKDGPATLMDQISNPVVAAVLISLLLLGGGAYWYFTSQLEPFTADDLRYGDSMQFTVLNGDIDVTDEFIDLVLDNFETDEEVCRLHVTFSGQGKTSVTNGGQSELNFETDDSLIGVVGAKGSYGLNWLTVEKIQEHNFNDLVVAIHPPKITNSNECSNLPDSRAGLFEVKTTTWTEIAERDVIATQAEWDFTLGQDEMKGVTKSYGVGGLLGALESITPGFAIIFSPVEIRDILGTTLIETGATGQSLGWEWVVTGQDSIDGEEHWKVSMEHREIIDNCLGHARITMWVSEDSPWAVKQNVDIKISGKEGDRSACGAASQILGDLILPDGTLDLSLEISKNSLQRGTKLLDLGRSYSSMPSAGAYVPGSSELSDWGSESLHLPDETTLRQHSLEDGVGCLQHVEAVAANAALDDDGYIWRAIDNRSGQNTVWNLSWVSKAPSSGWVVLEVSGTPSGENCTYIDHGSHDNSPAHNRNDIPAALNISMLEEDLTDPMRHTDLHGDMGFFTSSGQYHSQTRVGHLVVTPDGEYTDWLNRLNQGDSGATSLDLSRTWTSGGWDNSLTMAMDATNGQVIGWNLVQSPA